VTLLATVFATEARGFVSAAGASGTDMPVDDSGASGACPVVDASGAVPAPGLRDPGRVFAALADPRRRELLELLASAPGTSAGALAARLPVSRQAVAQHLAVLEDCALVSRRRAGRQVLFSVRTDGLTAGADWLQSRATEWLAQ
jgi:DNA-binding transcriptional ArsR family regulator